MRDRNIEWLYRELPQWVSKNVITEENAAKIQQYYGPVEETNRLRLALAIFGTLGAVLISSGIILVFAKNWENLSISARTILSLIPLILGQLLVGWVIVRDEESLAWREGAGAFLFIAVGASISLIGQTYHLPGDAPQFVLTWMLLCIPIVYLLKVTLPAVFYVVGIVAWAGLTRGEEGYTFFYWFLLLIIMGYFLNKFKHERAAHSTLFLLWALGLSLCLSLGIVFEHQFPGLWIIAYSSYFALCILLGRTIFHEKEISWQNPLLFIGTFGSLILSFVLTYQFIWSRVGWKYFGHSYWINTTNAFQDYVVAAVLLGGAAYLISRKLMTIIKEREWIDLIFAALPMIAIIGFLLASFQWTRVSDLIFDAYLLILGIVVVTQGLKRQHLGLANGGLLIIAVLIVLRFFDSNLGFLEKGIAFILVGSGFLLANIIMVRRQRGGLR